MLTKCPSAFTEPTTLQLIADSGTTKTNAAALHEMLLLPLLKRLRKRGDSSVLLMYLRHVLYGIRSAVSAASSSSLYTVCQDTEAALASFLAPRQGQRGYPQKTTGQRDAAPYDSIDSLLGHAMSELLLLRSLCGPQNLCNNSICPFTSQFSQVLVRAANAFITQQHGDGVLALLRVIMKHPQTMPSFSSRYFKPVLALFHVLIAHAGSISHFIYLFQSISFVHCYSFLQYC